MRLVTRSDFDGLVCAVLLSEKNIIDDYKFVHPKDVQDGKVEVTKDDVLANVPYLKGCGLWFDHHSSEEDRQQTENLEFEGDMRVADSAAQVIWDYYGGEKSFKPELASLLVAVNKTDSGKLTEEEILYPEGWILLSFIMDARTGLGRFSDYQISNYQLMRDMVQYCRTMEPEQIMVKSDVQERVIRYFDQQELCEEMLKRCTTTKGNVIITNLLNEETIYSGNRFLIYGLFPKQNVDIRIMWGKNKQNVVFACGHSILNRTCKSNIGELMLKFGGGGHRKVGTCQIEAGKFDEKLEEVIKVLRKNG